MECFGALEPFAAVKRLAGGRTSTLRTLSPLCGEDRLQASALGSVPGTSSGYTHVTLAVDGLQQPVSDCQRTGGGRCHRLAGRRGVGTDSDSRIPRRGGSGKESADIHRIDDISLVGVRTIFRDALTWVSRTTILLGSLTRRRKRRSPRSGSPSRLAASAPLVGLIVKRSAKHDGRIFFSPERRLNRPEFNPLGMMNKYVDLLSATLFNK